MSNSFFLFLGLSIMAHGVVLGVYTATSEEPVLQIPHMKSGGITISVNISKPVITAKTGFDTNNVNKQKKSTSIIKPIKITTIKIQKSVIASVSSTLKKQNATQHHSMAPALEKADGETISKILYTEFSKYFFYPKAAQRRNLQGKVTLQFSIEANGVINQIQISESSGYPLLDNAALDALKKIDNTKRFLTALNGNSVEQILPVVYQLK